MKFVFKLSTICFIVCFTCFQIAITTPVSASDNISRTAPQMLGTPEEDLSTFASSGGSKSKVGIWVGAILGVALIAALAGSAGGGDDSSGSTHTTNKDTGSVSVSWGGDAAE